MTLPATDGLTVLREYRQLAPWGLRDLSAVASAILEAAEIVPINAVARSRPTERTIRFYVARGAVSPPEGRGTAAVYSYRHLLQVLWVKLRQMEGATLEAITKDQAGATGDVIERRVAATLGSSLLPPARLRLVRSPGSGRGRVGRALQGWLRPPDGARPPEGVRCRRIAVAPGLELVVDEEHPLLKLQRDPAEIAAAFRRTMADLVEEPDAAAAAPTEDDITG